MKLSPSAEAIGLSADEAEHIVKWATALLKLDDPSVIARQLFVREALGGVKAEDSSLYKRTFGE